MQEGGIEEVQRMMKVALSLLPSDVRFNIIGFGSYADYLFVDRFFFFSVFFSIFKFLFFCELFTTY